MLVYMFQKLKVDRHRMDPQDYANDDRLYFMIWMKKAQGSDFVQGDARVGIVH